MKLGTMLPRAALILSLLSGDAQASLVDFEFRSTVRETDGSLSGVQVGTVFFGRFSFDAATPKSPLSAKSDYYNFGASGQVEASIAGHTVVSDRLNIVLTDNFGGNVEDVVSVEGYPALVDGNFYPQGFFGFFLFSSPGNTGVLTDTDLPAAFDVQLFDGFSYGQLLRNGGQHGGILTFSVDQIREIPEPDTAALVLFGLGVLGISRRPPIRTKAPA